MSDEEFDVLDELYFVQSFNELLSLTEKPAHPLSKILESIYNKGWIKVLKDVDQEAKDEEIDFKLLEERNYYFLATKSGLLAHNS